MKDGKAIFEAAEDLEDAKVYTVTSEDLSVPANTTVTAKVADAYAKDFFTETKKVAVLEGGKTHTNIVVKVKDQYGNVMNDLPTGTAIEGALNGMPLKGDIKIENGKVTVSNQNLKAEDELTFTLSYVKDGEKKETITSEEFKFELEKGETAEATTIDAVTDDREGKEILPTVGETPSIVKLTADVRDQYGNEIVVGATDIRWVVTKGADLIKIGDQNLTNDPIIDGGKELTFEAVDSGDVVIEAYLKSKAGEKATYTTTIGVVEVSSLEFTQTADSVITTNKAEKAVVLGTVKPNSGATIKPEDVKFKVTKKGDDDKQVAVPEGVVEAKAVYAKDAEGKDTDVIQVEVKATETGEYTVTPYVVVDGKEVVAETPGTFTSGPEGTIDEIVIDYKAKNEKVEKGLEIPVTFKNEHGEEIQLDKNTVNVTTSNPAITPKLVKQVVDGKETGKMVLKFYTSTNEEEDYKAVEAGVARITLQSGDVIETVDVKFVGAEITTVEVTDAKAEIIAGTDEDPVYNQVTFFDQDNEEMAQPTDAKVEVVDKDGQPVTNATATIVDVYFNDKGEIVKADKNTTVPTFKAVEVKAPTAAAGDYKVVVTAAEKTDDKEAVEASFDLKVKEARALDTIEIAPEKSVVSLGADSVSTVKFTDQYGQAMDKPENAEVKLITTDEDGEEKEIDLKEKELEQVKKGTEVVKGEYTLTISQDDYQLPGNFTIVVESEVKAAEATEDAVVKKATADLKVVEGANAIKDVNIVNPDLIGDDGKAMYFVKSEDTVAFDVEAFDEEGNSIVPSTKDVIWSVDNGEGEVEGTTFTVTAPTVTEGEEKQVTVKLDIYGDIVKEFTFTVKNDEEVAQKDTLKATTKDKDGKEVEVDLTEGIVIDENSPNGAVELTFTATDQYGKEMDTFSKFSAQSLSSTTADAVTEGNNKVVVTALKEGDTEIRTIVDLNDIKIPVVVKKEAVAIAKDAKTLADALPKVPGVKEDKPLTIEGKDTNPSAKAVKEAVEKEIQAKENGIAVEVVNATDDQDVARSTQEDVDGQDTEDETTTVEYNVTLSKGDAEKQELTVYAQFVLDPETEAANALTKAKEEAISQLKQEFPAENYTGTGEGDAGNKEAYDKAMKAAEEAINAATVATALTEQKTKLGKVKTDTQLEKEANEEAAATALTTAEATAKTVNLANGDTDVDQDAAVEAIKEAIETALKGENEETFAGKVEVTVEDNGFTAATNGTSETEGGTEGSIKFKITITVGEDDVAGTAISESAIELKIQPKAFVPETEGSGEEETSGENQTEPEASTQP